MNNHMCFQVAARWEFPVTNFASKRFFPGMSPCVNLKTKIWCHHFVTNGALKLSSSFLSLGCFCWLASNLVCIIIGLMVTIAWKYTKLLFEKQYKQYIKQGLVDAPELWNLSCTWVQHATIGYNVLTDRHTDKHTRQTNTQTDWQTRSCFVAMLHFYSIITKLICCLSDTLIKLTTSKWLK